MLVRARPVVWLVWLAFVATVTIPQLVWHVEYFRNTGPYYWLILSSLPVLAAISLAYDELLRRRLWRWEPAVLAPVLLFIALAVHPGATLVSVSILVATYSAGGTVSRRLGLEVSSPAARLSLFSLGGFGLLTIVLFVLGLCGWFYAPIFAALLAGATAAGWRQAIELPRDLARLWRGWAGSDELGAPLTGMVVVFALVLAGATALVMLSPTMTFDALVYHLPDSLLFHTGHALRPSMEIPQSFFPQGVEVWQTLALALGGQFAAQMIGPLFFVLFLVLLVAVARECGASKCAAVLGVGATAATPFLHWSGSVPKNDLAMAAYELASLYCLARWTKDRRYAWPAAATFFLGQAFGVKHVALFGAIPIGLILLWTVWQHPKRMRAALGLGLIFAASCLFWHLQTYLLTGSPLFPRSSHTLVEVGGRGPRGFWPAVLRYLRLPWRWHFRGSWVFESVTPNPMGVFLMLFAPLALLVRRERWTTAQKLCAFFVVCYLPYWALAAIALRYAIVPFSLVFLFLASRLEEFMHEASRLIRVSARLAALYSFLFAIPIVLVIEVNALEVSYVFGRVDLKTYLTAALPSYRSLEAIRKLDPGAPVYGVSNCTRYYAPDPLHFQCTMCDTAQCELSALVAVLDQGRFRYLILPNLPDFQPWSEEVVKRYAAREVHRDDWFLVFRLGPAGRL